MKSLSLALTAALTLYSTSALALPSGKLFDKPELAAEALATAARSGDVASILAVLGPDGKQIISSGDQVADVAARQRFLVAYDAKHNIELTADDNAVLNIGEDAAPFPIPLVKVGSAWGFDSAKGAEEILSRRIGINELEAIESLHAYVEAQETYAQYGVAGAGGEFAQRLISSPGKRDGLYWPASSPDDESPLGPLISGARQEGYGMQAGRPQPYRGYSFRILKRQGKNAPGGPRDFLVGGRMIAGFAMVASPAEYGVSGVMTFIVGPDDIVFQKDLGPETARKAADMLEFDPDATWVRAEP